MKRALVLRFGVIVTAVSVFFIQCNNTEVKNNNAPDQVQLSVTDEEVVPGQPSLGNIRALVSGDFTRPLWSPDGTKILFTRFLYYFQAWINVVPEIKRLDHCKFFLASSKYRDILQ